MSDEAEKVQPTEPNEARPDPDFLDLEQMAFELQNNDDDPKLREKRRAFFRSEMAKIRAERAQRDT